MDKSPKEKSSKQERDMEKNEGEGTVMSNAEKRASILMRKNGGKYLMSHSPASTQ